MGTGPSDGDKKSWAVAAKTGYSGVIGGDPIRTMSREGLSFREIPAFWERCTSDGTVARLGSLEPPGSTIGVAGVSAEFDMQSQEFSYLIAIESPSERSTLPAGYRDIPVAGGTWGVFESHGPLPDSTQGVMQRIFSEWFPSSGWEHANRPELEVYSSGDIRAANYYSEVWIPLQKPASAPDLKAPTAVGTRWQGPAPKGS